MLAKTRTDKDMKIVIIGGNAAGLSMLAQIRRHTEAEIIVLERGAHVGYASCGLPYYVGGTIKERADLLPLDPAAVHARFGADVRTEHEVLRIDTAERRLEVRTRVDGDVYQLSYEKPMAR